ncbi:hypothetical protein J6590_046610 [Homalodisca vitripennis]|nr:hypothetical protein J6590_046610 [Homalodisca vitripennis]
MAVKISPTARYAEISSGVEVKDLKRRRLHSRRKENINFKPPPEDWPEPVLGVGDFVVSDQSDATSLSPLQAYQAKLEQELLKQQEEETHVLENVNQLPKSPIWTSSEEDMKKLLDPNELLRHNKKLRPFVASQDESNGERREGDTIKSSKKQGSNGRPPSIKSLTALKAAKTALKKTRRKTKITTDTPTRKYRKRKTTKVQLTEGTPSSKEMKKQISQVKENIEGETKKIRKRRKPVRKFAFATHQSQEEDNEIVPTKTKPIRTKKVTLVKAEDLEISTLSPVSPTSPSTRGRPTIVRTVEHSNWKINRSTTDISVENSSTTQKITTESTNNTLESTDSRLITTEQCVSTYTTLAKVATVTFKIDQRNKIREKRKQMKQEMEEVIKAEELEGSFGDKDSDWTTSEKRKFPITSETKQSILLGLMRNKIMSFVDSVLRRSTRTSPTTPSMRITQTNTTAETF